jgi:hypothetical protein
MAHADATALAAIQPLLRQLREIKGVREMKPGTYYFRGAAFAHFHVEDGALLADLKKPGGSGFDRYPLDTAPRQRKFIDDARLRAGKLDDE